MKATCNKCIKIVPWVYYQALKHLWFSLILTNLIFFIVKFGTISKITLLLRVKIEVVLNFLFESITTTKTTQDLNLDTFLWFCVNANWIEYFAGILFEKNQCFYLNLQKTYWYSQSYSMQKRLFFWANEQVACLDDSSYISL